MPSTYYVYHGSASEADPYDTWAKAAHSLQALDTAKTFASGDIIYIASDHVDPTTASGNLTITGPTSGLPTIIISANRTTTLYEASSTNQVNTTAGAYQLLIKNFALYGVCVAAGARTQLCSDSDTKAHAENCIFKLAANSDFYLGTTQDFVTLRNCTIDLTADGTTARATSVFTGALGAIGEAIGLTFVNAAYRTRYIFEAGIHLTVSSCDFSGFTNATLCEIGGTNHGVFSNCLTAATWGGAGINVSAPGVYYNCGPADAPTSVIIYELCGTLVSTTSIYRTGGATVEGDATSWLITTTTSCCDSTPFFTPWIYGTVASTGSKTFDLYITNDTADLTDAECWLEVEYLSTSDEAIWALATDQRATITATAAAQTDDTSSTWNGTGPSFTYKQSLAVTATIGETGQYRARVAVGKASIASSAYFYVDPKVTVT